MARFKFILVAAALGLAACGGGGSGSTPVDGGSVDTDPAKSPAVASGYYNIPTTPLGAQVDGGTVTFSYWNPAASSVTVKFYANWNDKLANPAGSLTLTKGQGSVWTTGSVAVPAQAYYAYNVDGTYVLDPYAASMAQWVHTSSAGIDGDTLGKGAIVASAGIGPDGGWTAYNSTAYFDGSKMKAADGSAAPYAYAAGRDAIIYEAGVRDLTVDPFLAGFAPGHVWGTFKGLVDMLPHIQKLGVTHVQLLCPLENFTYDQTKVGTRELDGTQVSGANYNWGYDPQNYFTPTGMYSAAPNDPTARINELKTLVNEIHKQGMGVILDVVYNHTASDVILSSNANGDYYYRASSRNGAGSRDVASERKMVRKLVVDSVSHWVNEYKVDGFRFDLMGVLDTVTVKDAYLLAKSANPNALFLGEGWKDYYTGPATDYNGDAVAGADQAHAAAFTGMNVAMFSDSYRNLFKNGYPNDGAPAFLTGLGQNGGSLFSNVSGKPTNWTAPSTSNVVNYLTCHDNLCYYDVLAKATGATPAQDGVVLQRAKVGYAVLMTSQGVTFLHAGDEMFRSKEVLPASGTTRRFVDNSYNASDAINMVKWSRVYASDPLAGGFAAYDTAQNGYKLYAYTQGLIALRKSTTAFRLPDASLAANLTALNADGAGTSTLAFGYKAVSTDPTPAAYYVFHNADGASHSFTLPASITGAQLLVDGDRAGTTALAGSATVTLSPDGRTVTLAGLSSAVFKL